MPTVLKWKGYRFYFFSNEGFEPPHIHIDKAGKSAKFWLVPIKLAKNLGFADNELAEIKEKLQEDSEGFIDAWNRYFRA